MAQEIDGQLVPSTTQDHLTQYLRAFREEMGADFVDAPQSPTGQWIRLAAALNAISEEVVFAALNNSLIGSAKGAGLDYIGNLLSLPRGTATFTRVRVTFRGTPGVYIAPGTRVRATTGAVFQLQTRGGLTIGSDGETGRGIVRSQRPGAFPVGAGEINQIVDSAVGISSVNNDAGTNQRPNRLGRDAERDEEYRRRLQASRRTGIGFAESIQSALLALPGVTEAIVLSNDTAVDGPARQGVTIAAGSLLCAVLGGDDDDVARTVWNNHPPGIATDGTQTVTVRIEPFSYSVKFSRIEEAQIKVNVTTVANAAEFPPNGAELIREALLDFASGIDTPLTVGAAVDVNAFYAPLYSVQGHRVTALTITDTDDAALPAETPLLRIYRLQRANINLSVTSA